MVASIGKIASPAQGAGKFERDGYYARDDGAHREASARAGKGAEALGLEGPVDPEAFRRVLEGEVPGGRRLGRKEIDGTVRHRPRPRRDAERAQIRIADGEGAWLLGRQGPGACPQGRTRPRRAGACSRVPAMWRATWRPGRWATLPSASRCSAMPTCWRRRAREPGAATVEAAKRGIAAPERGGSRHAARGSAGDDTTGGAPGSAEVPCTGGASARSVAPVAAWARVLRPVLASCTLGAGTDAGAPCRGGGPAARTGYRFVGAVTEKTLKRSD